MPKKRSQYRLVHLAKVNYYLSTGGLVMEVPEPNNRVIMKGGEIKLIFPRWLKDSEVKKISNKILPILSAKNIKK